MVKRWNEKHDLVDRNLLILRGRLDELAREKQAREAVRDLPDPVDHNKMAVEEAGTMHQANVQRVAAVEVHTCLGPSVLAAYFAELTYCFAGLCANDHPCRVDSSQRWSDPDSRGITLYHGQPSSSATRVC